jgi:hypothetical protein
MQPLSPVIPTADADEVVYTKEQPEYRPLPCIRAADGTILTRWSLNEQEKRKVLEQGYIYLTVMTFNQPLQPILMIVDPPTEFVAETRPLEEWPDEIEAKEI